MQNEWAVGRMHNCFSSSADKGDIQLESSLSFQAQHSGSIAFGFFQDCMSLTSCTCVSPLHEGGYNVQGGMNKPPTQIVWCPSQPYPAWNEKCHTNIKSSCVCMCVWQHSAQKVYANVYTSYLHTLFIYVQWSCMHCMLWHNRHWPSVSHAGLVWLFFFFRAAFRKGFKVKFINSY